MENTKLKRIKHGSRKGRMIMKVGVSGGSCGMDEGAHRSAC